MKEAFMANIALRLLGEYINLLNDADAKAHYNALVVRLRAIEDEMQRMETTTVDSDGNITIGLKPVGMAGAAIAAGR